MMDVTVNIPEVVAEVRALRFPGLGWKVVSAHVSAMSAPPPR